MIRILGYLLIASPLIGVTIFGIKNMGWKPTLFALGLLLGIVGVVVVGTFLAGLN